MDIYNMELTITEKTEILPDDVIFLAYRGSIAHGMYLPSTYPNSVDDKDVMGVFVANIDHYIGIKQQKETREKWLGQWDCVYYELLKLTRLLEKGNPNVLSLLWVDNKYVIHTSNEWNLFKENKGAFSSRQVYKSFVGYARGQLKRMTHMKFEGYMGQKRKQLVEKYGYDCKNAAHLIRLLRMGIEFLTEGVLYVERTHDVEQLLEIKHGKWSLDAVKKEADEMFTLCETAYKNSSLPETPDREKINNICVEILRNRIKNKENENGNSQMFQSKLH